MIRKTVIKYHFTKDSSATGSDAPQKDSRQTEEIIKGSQAGTDFPFLAQPQNKRSDNSPDTERRPRQKTQSPTTEVRPLTATL